MTKDLKNALTRLRQTGVLEIGGARLDTKPAIKQLQRLVDPETIRQSFAPVVSAAQRIRASDPRIGSVPTLMEAAAAGEQEALEAYVSALFEREMSFAALPMFDCKECRTQSGERAVEARLFIDMENSVTITATRGDCDSILFETRRVIGGSYDSRILSGQETECATSLLAYTAEHGRATQPFRPSTGSIAAELGVGPEPEDAALERLDAARTAAEELPAIGTDAFDVQALDLSDPISAIATILKHVEGLSEHVEHSGLQESPKWEHEIGYHCDWTTSADFLLTGTSATLSQTGYFERDGFEKTDIPRPPDSFDLEVETDDGVKWQLSSYRDFVRLEVEIDGQTEKIWVKEQHDDDFPNSTRAQREAIVDATRALLLAVDAKVTKALPESA